MGIVKVLSLKAVIAMFLLGCSDVTKSTWSHELDVFFSNTERLGETGILQGYLTSDGRLWLYKEDAYIQRLNHSMQLVGLPSELLQACSGQFVTIEGRLTQVNPIKISDITALVPLNRVSGCSLRDSG